MNLYEFQGELNPIGPYVSRALRTLASPRGVPHEVRGHNLFAHGLLPADAQQVGGRGILGRALSRLVLKEYTAIPLPKRVSNRS